LNQSLEISYYHPLLFGIAKRMLGSTQDAEDVVQDTFLRWLSVDQEKIANKKAYLIRSVRNNCLNHINSFNEKKKEYMETWNSFEFVAEEDFADFDLETEIAEALGILQKKLEPVEKAIYLMREVFNVEYDELTEMFDKKKDNCRKIVSRAKEKLSIEGMTFNMEIPSHKSLIESFTKACSFGDPEEIIHNMNREIEERKQKLSQLKP
jgi:RNA polymerase sigma factor (sigma-70 family)